MDVSKLSAAFALVGALAAGPALAQVAPIGSIRQPSALTPPTGQRVAVARRVQQPAANSFAAPQPIVVPQPVTATPAAAVQQPDYYSANAASPAASAATGAIPAIQQPRSQSFAADRLLAPPPAPPMQQPAVFNPPAAPPLAEPAGLAQPAAIGVVPSTLANYYDEEEDSDDEEDELDGIDEEEDEDEDEDDECGEDVDCGDEAECDKPTICGFTCGGWIEQGFTFNPYDPQDGNNGTVVLNDLANQWQMNQLWFYMEREVDNGGCGWDWGGRFDVLYGTDGEYFQMIDGLEESWGQNGQYQVALLRFYYDIAYNDWTFRVGRFDTLVGYEPYDATESFFYSRSYNFYAQPGSVLGALLTRHLSDQLSVSAGLHRGDMQFDDTDGKDSVDFLGGFSWNSYDEETWIDAYLQAEEQGIGAEGLDYSFVFGTMLNEDWEYVAEWYWGQTDQINQQAEWYGLNQHFMREINDCWSHGFRFEWFRDDDGFIITDFIRGNSAQGPFDGNFYELTYAINYRPCENFVLRPEVRWDWYNQSAPGPLPFDDGTESDQFLLSIDAIYAF